MVDAINRIPAPPNNWMSQTARGRNAPTPADASDEAVAAKGKTFFSPEEWIKAKEEAAKQQLQQAEEQQKLLREQLESANEQAEAVKDSAETQGKCLTIAMRIMAGDKVPQQDYRYLAKNNSELYAKAITLRVERSDPRKYKRVSEDEKPDQSAVASQALESGESAEGSEAAPAPDGDAPAETPPAEAVQATLDVRA